MDVGVLQPSSVRTCGTTCDSTPVGVASSLNLPAWLLVCLLKVAFSWGEVKLEVRMVCLQHNHQFERGVWKRVGGTMVWGAPPPRGTAGSKQGLPAAQRVCGRVMACYIRRCEW